MDKDESTGDIRAIHRYDRAAKAWAPYLVAVDYLIVSVVVVLILSYSLKTL
nr:MAG TPA: hypothetical protein [Crassvirales sp.]